MIQELAPLSGGLGSARGIRSAFGLRAATVALADETYCFQNAI